MYHFTVLQCFRKERVFLITVCTVDDLSKPFHNHVKLRTLKTFRHQLSRPTFLSNAVRPSSSSTESETRAPAFNSIYSYTVSSIDSCRVLRWNVENPRNSVYFGSKTKRRHIKQTFFGHVTTSHRNGAENRRRTYVLQSERKTLTATGVRNGCGKSRIRRSCARL